MEREIYARMAEVEDRHWWFVSRRAIVARLLDRFGLPANPEILEAGCGTGGNLPMLSSRGRICALEPDDDARKLAIARGRANIQPGLLPDSIPFAGRSFDLVLMTDVLEHIADDEGALRALRTRLKPHGLLVLTVPALRWLWSEHDVSHHHRTRYDAGRLRTVAIAAGYEVSYLSYYNLLLFPAIASVRMFHRLIPPRSKGEDLRLPPRLVNQALVKLFSSERYLLGRISFPIGVSLLMVARNPAQNLDREARLRDARALLDRGAPRANSAET